MNRRFDCRICLDQGKDHHRGNRPNRATYVFTSGNRRLHVCDEHEKLLSFAIKAGSLGKPAPDPGGAADADRGGV